MLTFCHTSWTCARCGSWYELTYLTVFGHYASGVCGTQVSQDVLNIIISFVMVWLWVFYKSKYTNGLYLSGWTGVQIFNSVFLQLTNRQNRHLSCSNLKTVSITMTILVHALLYYLETMKVKELRVNTLKEKKVLRMKYPHCTVIAIGTSQWWHFSAELFYHISWTST